MIPILYKAKETDFTHNGIGPLKDVISCIVTEERNGAFEAEFVYPTNGALYPLITEDCIFKAKPNETSEPQLFRIYKSSKPMNKKVTFYGEHISYCLSGNPIESIEVQNENASAALDKVLSAGIFGHNFEGQSDIETLNSTSLSLVSIRAALGGVEGSLLDIYGGEYEFDNFTVKLHAHRGRDTGIRIAYGKNLTDIKQDRNISKVYTAVYPYAKYAPEATDDNPEPSEITVTLPEKIIYSQYADLYAHKRAYIKNFTDYFDRGEEITVEKLRAVAESWAKTSGFDIPQVSITVSFETLWESPEYAKYAIFERVALCDTLLVFYEELGVSAKAKVIKTVFDSLKEKYITVELGDARSNFADTIQNNVSEVNNVKREMEKQAAEANIKLASEIARATAAITGQSGGYVVLNPPKNPQEILIMDTPDINIAKNVWRWNSSGLGHSSKGYNGPFNTAITADGRINADFINGGTIKGQIIKGGNISGSNIEIFNGNLTVYSGSNTSSQKAIYFDEKGNLQYKGHISSFDTNIKCKIGKTDLGTFIYTGLSLTEENENYLYNNDYIPYLSFCANADSLKSVIIAHEHLDICVGEIMPSNTIKLSCTKNGGNLYGTWYGTSSQAIPSDRNVKHDIESLPELYSKLFDNLNPVRYKYNDGKSDRFHTGFIAQDVEEAIKKSGLDTKEFAGYIVDPKGNYYLRYEEFIALAVNEIQTLKDKNSKLEERVTELEEKINSIIQRLEE